MVILNSPTWWQHIHLEESILHGGALNVKKPFNYWIDAPSPFQSGIYAETHSTDLKHPEMLLTSYKRWVKNGVRYQVESHLWTQPCLQFAVDAFTMLWTSEDECEICAICQFIADFASLLFLHLQGFCNIHCRIASLLFLNLQSSKTSSISLQLKANALHRSFMIIAWCKKLASQIFDLSRCWTYQRPKWTLWKRELRTSGHDSRSSIVSIKFHICHFCLTIRWINSKVETACGNEFSADSGARQEQQFHTSEVLLEDESTLRKLPRVLQQEWRHRMVVQAFCSRFIRR